MEANYKHAWQLDVEFGKLDAQYAQELCEALMYVQLLSHCRRLTADHTCSAEYGMPVGIFEDVDEKQYTAILPPPVGQPGLIFYCAREL